MTLDKVERLLSVMNVLLDVPGALTGQTIRSRVPGYPDDDASFKRQFERDKNELRDMGVPLLVEPVPGSDPPVLGYRIRARDYELKDPGLEPDELEALNMAAAAVGSDGGHGRLGLFKLGGAAVPTGASAELPADPDLVAAFRGVAELRTLAFRYHDQDRLVEPQRLEFSRGHWYLGGLDRTRGEHRWFRMSRIQTGTGARIALGDPGSFERTGPVGTPLQLDPWRIAGDDEPTTATVWFDPQVAVSVRSGLPESMVISDDEEGLVVAMEVANPDGFVSWVLSYLDRAEVLAPVELRSKVVDWLTGLVDTGLEAS